MLGQIGLAFGCVNYLTTPAESAARPPGPSSRQRVHPEEASSSREMLAVPLRASEDETTPSPNAPDSIQPKISPLLASACTPTTECRTMTLYGYNAAAKLPFAFSHARERSERVSRGGERRSLRTLRPAPPTGRMVRSASSSAAEHVPPHCLVDRSHPPQPISLRSPHSPPGPQAHGKLPTHPFP